MWMVLAAGLLVLSQPAPAAFSSEELAAYRLTEPVFKRFQGASRGIAAAARADARYEAAPLFTREVMLSDDARTAAAGLLRRLEGDPALASAIRSAGLTSREFTTFVLALVAARLAHGFVAAGVLRAVPDGVAAANVAFIDAHQAEVAAVLALLEADSV